MRFNILLVSFIICTSSVWCQSSSFRLNGVIVVNESILENGCNLTIEALSGRGFVESTIDVQYIPGELLCDIYDWEELIKSEVDSIRITLELFDEIECDACQTCPINYSFTAHKELLYSETVVIRIYSMCYRKYWDKLAKYSVGNMMPDDSHHQFILTVRCEYAEGGQRFPVRDGVRLLEW